MVDTSNILLTLTLEDPALDSEDLENLTQTLQLQLSEITETIARLPLLAPGKEGVVEKGDQNEPGLLQMEVNLKNINKLATWLYHRITGKSTKAKLVFGEGSRKVEVELEGSNQQELAAILADMAGFVEKVAQIQQTQSDN